MMERQAGFSIIELLAAILIMGIAMSGLAVVFRMYDQTSLQQDVRLGLEQNLRISMDTLTDALRSAGYGVPSASLSSWITWVPSFTSNPKLVKVTGSPDTISVARASSQAVATLSAHVDVGATTLTLSSASAVDASSRSLLSIDGLENALVRSVSGTTVTIDTNPTTAGNQGLAHAYPAGTPVYRVDVLTFSVATDGTGTSQLLRDAGQGGGAQAVADAIDGLTIAVASKRYTITLSATSTSKDLRTGAYLKSSLTSAVSLRN